MGREIETQFTFGQKVDVGASGNPVWSRDAKRIAFNLYTPGNPSRLSAKASDGAGEIETLLVDGEIPWDWSKDGRELIYGNMQVLQLGDSGISRSAAIPSISDQQASNAPLSPDNRWIAYTSSASGQPEVFVQPYTSPGSVTRAGGKIQLSRNGGERPRWRGDGKELFYVSMDGLMAAPIEASGEGMRATAPTKLFDLDPNDFLLWDLSRDGQRFLVAKRITGGANPPIIVVENWRAALKK